MQTIFECGYEIPLDECDADNRWRLECIYRSMQYSSTQHTIHLGISRETLMGKYNMAWMLLGIQLKIERYPCCGDNVTLRTWPGVHGKVTYPRYYDILDCNLERIACGSSSWGLVDMGERKLVLPRAAEGIIPNLGDPGIQPPLPEPKKLNMDFASGKEFDFFPSESDIDENGHVNNIRYVELIMDIFKPTSRSIAELSLFFKSEIVLGQHIRLFAREDSGGFAVRVVDVSTEKDVFESYGVWGQKL